MIRYAIPLLVLTAAMSAGAATPQTPAERDAKELAKRLEGMTPGKPQACLSVMGINEVKFYNGTALYVRSRGQMWTNATRGGCDVSDDDIIVSRIHGSQYCAGDIIETRSRSGGFFTGSCSLGDFTPYRK